MFIETSVPARNTKMHWVMGEGLAYVCNDSQWWIVQQLLYNQFTSMIPIDTCDSET